VRRGALDLGHDRPIGSAWLRSGRDHRDVEERREPGEHLDISPKVRDGNILHRLEQARLVIEQEEHSVLGIDQHLASARGEDTALLARRRHAHFLLEESSAGRRSEGG
jgi:hypothetical protein